MTVFCLGFDRGGQCNIERLGIAGDEPEIETGHIIDVDVSTLEQASQLLPIRRIEQSISPCWYRRVVFRCIKILLLASPSTHLQSDDESGFHI